MSINNKLPLGKELPGGQRLAERYVRVTFDKDLRNVPGKTPAIFLHLGHPLLDATVSLIVEEFGSVMSRGAVLVDERDWGEEPRVLMCLEHVIHDGRTDRLGKRHVAGRRMQFVEVCEDRSTTDAGFAPYLDYRSIRPEEQELVKDLSPFSGTIEGRARKYAVTNLVPDHLREVQARCEERTKKAERAVRERLTQEISYWEGEESKYQRRTDFLRGDSQTARSAIRLNLDNARRRRRELEERLSRRLKELRQERDLKPSPPVVISAALVLPAGLLAHLGDSTSSHVPARDTRRVERLAMRAVMECERRLGHNPEDVSARKLGYDIESRERGNGRLRFIEVKGRAVGATSITVTRNEILTALNKPEDFILAIVEVERERVGKTRYFHQPFKKEPDFGATSVNYAMKELLAGETSLL